MEVSGQLHTLAALLPGKEPHTHCIGGWMYPRAVLDAMVKRKIPSSHQELNPITLLIQPIAQLCTHIVCLNCELFKYSRMDYYCCKTLIS
jgi:hypothetical protein